MKQANIGVFVVLALASTSLVARPQAKDVKGPASGEAQKSPHLRQVENYPTMLNMTFPEFASGTAKTDILLLSIGAIEEHGPNLPLATDSIVAVAQLIDAQHYLRIAKIETIVGPPLNIGITNEAGDHSRDAICAPINFTRRAMPFASKSKRSKQQRASRKHILVVLTNCVPRTVCPGGVVPPTIGGGKVFRATFGDEATCPNQKSSGQWISCGSVIFYGLRTHRLDKVPEETGIHP
jgi:hypothetical protein